MKLTDIIRRAISALLPRSDPSHRRLWVSPRQAGVLVNEDTAMTLAEWWACVSVLSRTVAALPWGVFERTPRGRMPVDNAIHWLLNNQPNAEMTAFSFREAMMAHVLNWGNGYAEIQRDKSGRVQALWLITPDRVSVERRKSDGVIVYKITSDGGEQREMTADQVFHVHGLGFDGLVGYSVVQMAARSIGAGIAQDVFSQSFYANGTVLGTVVEMSSGMSQQQIADAETYFNEKHRGPDNAFKVKVAPQGTKVHAMGMPLKDAQFVESRQMTITMAARWLGVPPHKIADLTRSTNNNIEHQGIEFVTDAILPHTVRFEQEANVKLFSARAQGRVYTKLMLNALMRGDSKSRAEYYRVMTQIGVMSVNEVRELEDMNSIGPAGDVHLVQLNQTTLEYLVANPGAKAQGSPASSTDDPEDEDEDADEETQEVTNVIRRQALEWYRDQRKSA